jgi:hypothetical protein
MTSMLDLRGSLSATSPDGITGKSLWAEAFLFWGPLGCLSVVARLAVEHLPGATVWAASRSEWVPGTSWSTSRSARRLTPSWTSSSRIAGRLRRLAGGDACLGDGNVARLTVVIGMEAAPIGVKAAQLRDDGAPTAERRHPLVRPCRLGPGSCGRPFASKVDRRGDPIEMRA